MSDQIEEPFKQKFDNNPVQGVALIDQFAMAASSGLIAQCSVHDPRTIARKAYQIAEAMMEKRLERTKSRYGAKKFSG